MEERFRAGGGAMVKAPWSWNKEEEKKLRKIIRYREEKGKKKRQPTMTEMRLGSETKRWGDEGSEGGRLTVDFKLKWRWRSKC